jgi:TRAP transporter 4TM/12TM fusion protein
MTHPAETARRAAAWWSGLALALFQLVVPVWAGLFDMQLRALHVLLTSAAILFAVPAFRAPALPWALLIADAAMVALAAAATLPVYVEWEAIITFAAVAEPIDLVLGAALGLIVLEAARRGAGSAIPIMVLLMFAYVFVGPLMPGIWVHPGFPLDYVIEQLYFSSGGLFGSLTGTSATFVAIFILFGALLQATGGGQTFMDLALLIAGRRIGGPAKVGVVASALFGMISGSAVANVSVTGNYTIPLMRRLGYQPDFAGGVEAMSSTGGGITPPVMGIAAFIMADFLNVPYLHVIGWAAIPCLLFYIGIVAGVHFEAERAGLAPVPAADLPKPREVLTPARLAPLVVPIGLLLVLLFRGASLTEAGFWACVSAMALYLFADLSRDGMRHRLAVLIDALAKGGIAVAQVAPVLIAVSMFTALLGLTGVAPKLSSIILELGAGNLVGALAVAALIPLLLGAPLPVTATYILSAALIAPALVRLGLDVAAVHMFLLYWATLASVTPPTCTACVIAANISGGNWFRTALVGMRLGFVAFLVPFFFVLNPALIARGPTAEVLIAAASGAAGALFMAAGFFGWFRTRLNAALRLVYLAAGVLLLAPSTALLAAGAGVAALGLGAETLRARRALTPR